MPKENSYIVVPRMEYNKYSRTWEAILFLPPPEPNWGEIDIYVHVGQHSSVDRLFFYSGTRPPQSVKEWKEALDLIEEERTMGPEEDWLKADIRQKIGR
jgi:hypothetical protein